MKGTFYWTQVGGFTSYEVQWNGSSTFDGRNGASATVTGSEWVPSAFTMSAEGEKSYFRIRAVGAPNSTWSAAYEFGTPIRLL